MDFDEDVAARAITRFTVVTAVESMDDAQMRSSARACATEERTAGRWSMMEVHMSRRSSCGEAYGGTGGAHTGTQARPPCLPND